MKTTPWPRSRLICLLALAVSTLAFAASAHATSKVADLQVQVDVPAAWEPFLEDDVSEALVRILRERFRRLGYGGVIDHVQHPRAPNPDLPLLSLRLVEWRINRAGSSECTLAAALRPASSPDEIDLGLVSHSRLTWNRDRGRFGFARAQAIADALEDSAEGAMREIHRRAAETGKVPGLEPRKKK